MSPRSQGWRHSSRLPGTKSPMTVMAGVDQPWPESISRRIGGGVGRASCRPRRCLSILPPGDAHGDVRGDECSAVSVEDVDGYDQIERIVVEFRDPVETG